MTTQTLVGRNRVPEINGSVRDDEQQQGAVDVKSRVMDILDRMKQTLTGNRQELDDEIQRIDQQIAVLEALRAHRSSLVVLRDRLTGFIGGTDDTNQTTTTTARTRTATATTPIDGPTSLPEYIEAIFDQEAGPMTAMEIMERSLQAGYKSEAQDQTYIVGRVRSILSGNPRYRRTGQRGEYRYTRLCSR